MAKRKKRKTKQEKIILQLKRELAEKKGKATPKKGKNKARQGAISQSTPAETVPTKSEIKVVESAFLDNSAWIKKDLLKTAILSFIALSLQIVLYLRLR